MVAFWAVAQLAPRNCLAAKSHRSAVVKRERLISHECKGRFHSSIESSRLRILSRPATREAGARFPGVCPRRPPPPPLQTLPVCVPVPKGHPCPCVPLRVLPRSTSPPPQRGGERAVADCRHLPGLVLPMRWVIVILPESCPGALRETAFFPQVTRVSCWSRSGEMGAAMQGGGGGGSPGGTGVLALG